MASGKEVEVDQYAVIADTSGGPPPGAVPEAGPHLGDPLGAVNPRTRDKLAGKRTRSRRGKK